MVRSEGPKVDEMASEPDPEPACVRLLRRSLHYNREVCDHELATLATLNQRGEPSARTVWIRHIDKGCVFVVSDSRAHKMEHLRAHSTCELCWTLPMHREEFRFRCEARLIEGEEQVQLSSDDQLRQLRWRLWQESPEWLKQSFSCTLAPGTPLPPGTSNSDVITPSKEIQGKCEQPHPYFALIQLEIGQCDYRRDPIQSLGDDPCKPVHKESLLKRIPARQRYLYTKVRRRQLTSTSLQNNNDNKSSSDDNFCNNNNNNENMRISGTANAGNTAQNYEWIVQQLNP